MHYPNREIGWSQEAILLQRISMQLSFIYGLTGNIGGGGVPPIELRPLLFTAWNNGAGNIATNTSFGMLAFTANTTGYENTVFGYASMQLSTTGAGNTAIGYGMLSTALNGTQNTVVGRLNVTSNTVSDYNTLIGRGLINQSVATTGSKNTGVGAFCLSYVSSGTGNTGMGTLCMSGLVGGSGAGNITGNYNIAAGYQANRGLQGGSNNIHFDIETSGGDGVINGNRNIMLDAVNTPRAANNFNNNVVICGLTNSMPLADDQVIIGTGNGTIRTSFNSSGGMIITTAPTNGTGVETEKVLLLDAVSDANGMSSIKTVDYIATNGTIANLTGTDLNNTYNNASIGLRVVCQAITGAPKVYTKVSATAWCSEPILVVA